MNAPAHPRDTDREPALSVAVIEPIGGHGGNLVYDLSLCRSLHAAGIEATLYTCDESALGAENQDAEGFVRRDFHRIYGTSPKIIRAARFVRGLLSALRHAAGNGAKIAHFHLYETSLQELVSLLAARAFGFTVIATAHDVSSLWRRGSPALARLIYRIPVLTIAHSEVALRELRGRLALSMEATTVVPHGHYLPRGQEDLDRDSARRRLELPLDAEILLFFGQIKEVKGLDVLIHAFPLVLRTHPRARLLIVGKTWKIDWDHYRSRIEQLGIGASVIARIGYVPDDQIHCYFTAADVTALPYRHVYQSGVLIQAMSSGCPAVASDIPGMLELLTPGETGWTFRTGDPQSLAATLLEVLAEPQEAARRAAQARRIVEERLSWRAIGEATAKLYRTARPAEH